MIPLLRIPFESFTPAPCIVFHGWLPYSITGFPSCYQLSSFLLTWKGFRNALDQHPKWRTREGVSIYRSYLALCCCLLPRASCSLRVLQWSQSSISFCRDSHVNLSYWTHSLAFYSFSCAVIIPRKQSQEPSES